ncbi:alanine racemase [Nocardioides ginsengisoli]|uniref:Alanine racemase n=1 Tax=Nocardioides ginsengisoli TaxID=363868 RepID=A0ABW3W7N4_9ACTN
MSRLAVQPRAAVSSGPQLTVDLAAIGRNTARIAAATTGEVMAVVKADGFGHGAADVARTALAHGATRLGVTCLAEAWALLDAGLVAPILSWLNPVDADFATAAARDVEVAVPSLAHLAGVAAAAGRPRVHLHIDTGMARDGAEPSSWGALCRAARRAEQRGELEVVGVMGHLGCADDPDDACNALGRTRFAWAVDVARGAGLRPRDRHLAATAATLTDPRSHHTMSRIGAGLVGIDPSGTTDLEAAMTLTAPLVQVRRVRAGTAVGYGHAYRTPTATHLGLISLGYADGLPRIASGQAEVLVRGVRHPVVGRISMDQAVVDLGAEGADAGETVTVLGGPGAPSAAEWAAWAGTIEHEIVTGIGARVPRRTRAASYLRAIETGSRA